MRRRAEFQTAEESFSHPGAGPADQSRELAESERCLCGRRVEFTIKMRRRSIGLCGRCWERRIMALKRGSGRGA